VANEDQSQVDSIAVGYTSPTAARQGKAFLIPETPNLTHTNILQVRFELSR